MRFQLEGKPTAEYIVYGGEKINIKDELWLISNKKSKLPLSKRKLVAWAYINGRNLKWKAQSLEYQCILLVE